MRRLAVGALEIVVPLGSTSTGSAPASHRLARTVASLAPLSLDELEITLVLVGDKAVSANAQAWLGDNAPSLGVRLLDFEWANDWSVLAVGARIATRYFAVLEPGSCFVWPDDVPLTAVAQGALCFEAPRTADNAHMSFWVGGNLAPLNLGPMRGTALWHGELCERARIILCRMDDGRRVPIMDPWRAYLAANEDRLAGAHRLVPA